MTPHEKLRASLICLGACLLVGLLLTALVRRASFAVSFALFVVMAGFGLAAISLAMQSTGH